MLSRDEIRNLTDCLAENRASGAERALFTELIAAGELTVKIARAESGSNAVIGDVKNSLILALSDGSTFVYRGETAATLRQIFEEYLNPDPPISTPTRKHEQSGRLHYTEPIEFIGRETEFKQLVDFCQSPSRLAWWLVTGSAGAGKSRLALELGRKMSKEGWQFGFLDDGEYGFKWPNWRPKSNTLLVVDYLSQRAKHVGSILQQLNSRQDRYSQTIRFLLLERAENEFWKREFFGAGGRLESLYESRYQENPLALGNLGNEQLWKILQSELALVSKTMPSKNASISNLLRIDPNGTPFYALILARGIAANLDPNKTSIKQLLNLQIDQDMTRRWKSSKDTKLRLRDENLLAYATIVGGFELEELEITPGYKKYFPSPKQYEAGRFESMTGEPCSDKVANLEPDLLGEYFVLRHLEPTGFFDRDRVKWFAKTAWKQKPLHTFSFVCRAVDDFPDDPILEHFLTPPESSSDANAGEQQQWEWISRDIALAHAVAKYANLQEPDKASRSYLRLVISLESHPPVWREVGVRCEAATNLCMAFARGNSRELAGGIYSEIVSLSARLPDDDLFYGDYLARAGQEMVTMYCNTGEIAAAERIFNEILDNRRVFKKWSTSPDDLARASLSLIEYYCEKNDRSSAVKVFGRIRTLRVGRQSRDFLRWWSFICFRLASDGSANQQDIFEMCREVQSCICEFPEAEEICFCGAASIFALVNRIRNNSSDEASRDNACKWIPDLNVLLSRSEQRATEALSLLEKNMWPKVCSLSALSLMAIYIVLEDPQSAYVNWRIVHANREEEDRFRIPSPLRVAPVFNVAMALVCLLCECKQSDLAELVYCEALDDFSTVVWEDPAPMSLFSTTLRLGTVLAEVQPGQRARRAETSIENFASKTKALDQLASMQGENREYLVDLLCGIVKQGLDTSA